MQTLLALGQLSWSNEKEFRVRVGEATFSLISIMAYRQRPPTHVAPTGPFSDRMNPLSQSYMICLLLIIWNKGKGIQNFLIHSLVPNSIFNFVVYLLHIGSVVV